MPSVFWDNWFNMMSARNSESQMDMSKKRRKKLSDFRISKTNEIYTKRLRLRYPELGDATDIYACVQSSEFPEQLPLKEMETVDAIIKWIKMLQTNWQDGRGYSWVAEMPDTKELIGQVTLSKMKEANKYAIAFWISPKHWLKGYATEAVEGVIAYGFEELGAEMIWASAGKWNQASQGVLEKTGMAQVGENLEGYYSKGEPIATYEYEIEKRY